LASNGRPGIAAKTRQIDGGGDNVHRCSRVQGPLMRHRLKSIRGIGGPELDVRICRCGRAIVPMSRRSGT
jgi:hypothetical protein